MGTRADFYVKKDKQIKWLGSLGFDGYPEGIDKKVLESKTEQDFETNLNESLKKDDSATMPEEGWPWPWKDSRTTDYAYIFENGKVMASCFGSPLFDPLIDREEQENEGEMDNFFPDMSSVQNVKLGGKQSGLIVISLRNPG